MTPSLTICQFAASPVSAKPNKEVMVWAEAAVDRIATNGMKEHRMTEVMTLVRFAEVTNLFHCSRTANVGTSLCFNPVKRETRVDSIAIHPQRAREGI